MKALREGGGRRAGAGNVLRLFATLVGLLTALAILPAEAAQTSGNLRGTVVDQRGAPVAGAAVTIRDLRTGSSKSATTADGGDFFFQALEVGGPYTVTVNAPGESARSVRDISINLGQTFTLTVMVGAREMVEEMVVTAQAASSAALALGPASSFDLGLLEAAPAINRDIKDVIRLDPRVYIDEGNVDAITCAGQNPRFNSLTVDGVRLNDNFGLNSNGYPTERIPFSFDAIQQVGVELAPFDVQFGGFSACNINAVTKSGTNEFEISAFYDYTDDGWTGDTLQGDPVDLGEFEEKRWGVSTGFPILEDRLFFFGAYEKWEGANVFDRGPTGSGRGREIAGVSQAQYDEILDIARTVYDYDPGGLPASAPNEDEKFLAKLTWEIMDGQRAAFTYNYNDGFNIAESDNDDNELEFSNHYYERGAELNSYVAQLFSDWTDRFSTELRIGYIDLENRQRSIAGTDFGEVQITTLNDADGDGTNARAIVYLGADDSRHANQLSYENWSFKALGTYALDSHLITFGYERDQFEAFNLFIQEAEGEYRFSSIDDFRNGRPNRITYENAAPSNVPADAAADFAYAINTLYLQDEILFSGLDLTVVAGLRYDWYESDDSPRTNPNFVARYGYSNSENLDGRDLLQPRVAFDWGLTPSLSVRGGFGLFSGGNPNVWISNNYSNDGITQVEVQDRSLDDAGNPDTLFTIPFTGAGRPIYDIPQDLFDAVASGTADSGVNSLDPDFEIPSSWKYNLGATLLFDLPGAWGQEYLLNADLIYSRAENSAIVRDITLAQVDTAADGRPIYRGIDRSDPDCADPTSADCSGRTQDFQLTNVSGADAEQTIFSLSLSKEYDNGIRWQLGYAYTDATDVNPMTSSVAFSNYSNFARYDPNNPGVATSNYEIPNRFTGALTFERAFFRDAMTRVSIFGSYNEGRPYSLVLADGAGLGFGDPVGFDDRHLLYVPTGPDDPNVVFAPGFDQAAFFDFVADQGLSPGIQRRNQKHSSWWLKFDVKVEQEIPIPYDGKASAFIVIENLGNLLNDDWGVLQEGTGESRTVPVVNAGVNDDGQILFNEFLDVTTQGRVTDASLWEVRAGIRVTF
ncbi:MAG: TonB-dependent receptor [Pseudomonadales bacterium]|jgi:hypothetical protein|nr:TonB-dependent receptor [Pseudomonadales bacterium]